MKKKKQKQKLWILAGIGVLGIIIIAAKFMADNSIKMEAGKTVQGTWMIIPEKKTNTDPVKIGVFDVFEWQQKDVDEWKKGIEIINQRLQKLGKEYHLEVEICVGRLESADDLQILQDPPDIVLGVGVLIPETEMQNIFLELTPYLESSALNDIYKKRSDDYWLSKTETEGLFNLASNDTGACRAVKLNEMKCEEIGYDLPGMEDAIDIATWEKEFEKIYQMNGNKPFIYWENSLVEAAEGVNTILDTLMPIKQPSIYSGLSFDGQSAVFPYNEELKKELLQQQSWAEKGFLTEEYSEALVLYSWGKHKTPYEETYEEMGTTAEEIIKRKMMTFPVMGEPFCRVINRYHLRSALCAILKEGTYLEQAMEVLSMINVDAKMREGIPQNSVLGQSMIYSDEEQIPDCMINMGLKELGLNLAPVREECEKVNRVITKYYPCFKLANYEQWMESYDQMVKEMYENGAQIIVDEVNKQWK